VVRWVWLRMLPGSGFRTTTTITRTRTRVSGLNLLNEYLPAQTVPTGQKTKALKGALVPKGKATRTAKAMKRKSNLHKDVCSIENLLLADRKARKGKSGQKSLQKFDGASGCNIITLHNTLMEKRFKTSEYRVYPVYEPKERLVYELPYIDRVVHHAIMNILEPLFVSWFTEDTYGCIKGRGIHGLQRNLRKSLQDVAGTTYYVKMDITKFYPSVNHEILKEMLRRKIKDVDLLALLDEIIDSAPGIPIGNYLSQYFSNFYLMYFDRFVKQRGAVHYFRYADDMLILGDNKPLLHRLRAEMQQYLNVELQLTMKDNYQVCRVDEGIDIVGYVNYHKFTLMRPSIKKRFGRAVAKGASNATIMAYVGWASHCNSYNLLNKLLHEKFPRPEHCTARRRKKGVHRRKNKNEQNTEPVNSNTRL